MDYLEIAGSSFLVHIPGLLAWLVGIVFGVRMIRHGGGKAEKLFLTGCSLMLLRQLANPFLLGLVWWLVHERGMSAALASGLAASLPMGVTGLAAVVCLIYAFWLKFRIRNRELA
jgi:hypothetical protein